MIDQTYSIFISHAAADEELAASLKDLLEQAFPGVGVFVSSDPENLPPGDPCIQQILGALKSAKAVLMMATERGLKRNWVWFEAGHAWFSGGKLIPCCAGKVRKGKLPAPFLLLTGLNIDIAGDLKALIQTLSTTLEMSARNIEVDEIATEFIRLDVRAEEKQKTYDDPNAAEIRKSIEATMKKLSPASQESLRQFVVHGQMTDTVAMQRAKESGLNLNNYWGPGALARETGWVVPADQNTQNDIMGTNRYFIEPTIRPYLREYFQKNQST